MIKLITGVGEVINRDPDVRERLRVVFLPNFNVTERTARLSRRRPVGADIHRRQGSLGHRQHEVLHERRTRPSERSTAQTSSLREEIGAENFFLFGLTAQEVGTLKSGGYRPMNYYASDPHLKEIIDLIRAGYFSHGDTELFRPLIDNLMYYDPYMLFADFASYVQCQDKVSEAYRDRDRWTRMAILNSARSGKFSSDRTIREYCTDIWQARPVPIHLLTQSQAGSAQYGEAAQPPPTEAGPPR